MFKNLVEVCQASCQKYQDHPAFGTKTPDGFRFISFAEFGKRVDAFRSGLAQLGIGPGDKVAVMSANRVEWAIAAYATYGRKAVFVPLYEAQTLEDAAYILNDCSAKLVIGSNLEVFERLRGIQPRVPSLEKILCADLPAIDPRSFAYVEKLGAAKPIAAEEPLPSDLAGLIYTSGTTGQPKGVMLTHRNFCANLEQITPQFPVNPGDRSLAFLPWAHALGQTADLHFLFSMGCGIAINDEIPNLVNNLPLAKPTILVAVPRIFNRIYDGVGKQIAAKPPMIQKLFHTAIAAATARQRGAALSIPQTLALKLAEHLIFAKIRLKFGGELRFAISGSAALSKEVAEFVDALGIRIYEGYGLTEATPVVSANCPKANRIGSVGKPLPGVRVTIDTDAAADKINGEIIVYGENVMSGYYNRPEETAEILRPDGGLRTGDMGHLDADGFLFITGRIKEQYKLENGKYVVPSPLEEVLKLSPYILNSMIYGDNRPFNVALVVLDADAVRKWAEAAHHQLGTDITQDAKVQELIRQELDTRSEAFRGYEKIKAFHLVTEDFTIENGLLTPSLKVRRKQVIDRYLPTLLKLYK